VLLVNFFIVSLFYENVTIVVKQAYKTKQHCQNLTTEVIKILYIKLLSKLSR